MADLENSSELLKQALDELRRSTVLSKDTIDKLAAAQRKAAGDTKELGEVTKTTAEKVDDFGKKVNQATRYLADAGNAIRDNREDFRSLNPAIKATGIAIGTTGKTLGNTMASLGEAISGVAAFIPGWGKLLGAVGGGALTGLGKAIGYSSDQMAQLGMQFGEFATNELQKVVESYRKVGAVGAIGAEGMTGMYEQAIKAGLSLGQFAEVVSRNGQGLALATGNTYEGARALTNLAEASKPFEEQFLALGISFEQQREFQAQFLQRNRMVGTIQLNDTRALTEASKAYVEQLDELARLTGQSRETEARALEEQLRNVRFQATLAKANIQDPSGELGKSISNVARVLDVRGSKELAAGFQDAFGGLGTEAARQFEIATGGAGSKIAEDLRSGIIDQNEALFRIQQAIQAKYISLGGNDFAERVGRMGTVMDPMLLGMMKMAKEQNLTIDALQQNKNTQTAASNATDKNTQEIISAQKALQNLGIELDKLVKDKILPSAATAVRKFTETLLASVDYINEKLGITPSTATSPSGRYGSPGTSGRGPGTPQAPTTGAGGAAAPTPEAKAQIDKVLDLIGKVESGGNYNSLVGGKTADLSNMTLNQVYEQQKKMMQRGSGFASSAVGKYQFIYGTLRSLANKMGLDPETTKFTPDVQDQIARELVVQQGYNKYAAGAITKEKFLSNLASQWAGLPGDPSGKSKYEGYNTNKAGIGWQEALGSFKDGGISDGPLTGYKIESHGLEAHVPLPKNRKIPVEISGIDRLLEFTRNFDITANRFDSGVNKFSNDTSSFDFGKQIGSATKEFASVIQRENLADLRTGPRLGYNRLADDMLAKFEPPAPAPAPAAESYETSSKMSEQLSAMAQQVNRLDTIITLMQSNVDISRNILRATTG